MGTPGGPKSRNSPLPLGEGEDPSGEFSCLCSMEQRGDQSSMADTENTKWAYEDDTKQRFWRGLDELAETQEYKDFLRHEYPYGAPHKMVHGGAVHEVNTLGRRDVLKLMAASTALAGLSACTKLPTEKIVPYVKPPEEIIPGRPLFYATSMPQPGGAAGLLVESHMGRPTKIEGNPEHPGSLGSTDVFAQASILNLYDPDRSQTVIFEGRLSSWGDFVAAMGNARARLSPQGAGLRV